MKRIYLFLSLLLSLLGTNSAWALDVPSGIMDVGNTVATPVTGKWYFLYNQGQQRYARENASNALKQTASPAGKIVTGNEGYLVTLEDAGSGKYYVKTGLGNYYKQPGTSANGTSATSTGCEYSIDLIEGTTDQYVLQGSGTYNLIAPATGGDLVGGTNKNAGKIGAWTFYEVVTKSPSELTGQDLYNYQMSVLGRIRIHNKRTSTAYLTSLKEGVATGASKAATGLSQIWILEKSGAGYTMRSANTGQYLQSTFGTPANGSATLYIQFSPNNTGTESYINVSSASDFSGQSCMNLGNNGTTVTKWSYANDSGSDWAIELVEDVTEDQVREHMNSAKHYASELKEGKYYRILSTAYSVYASESDNALKSIPLNEENYGQYWKVKKSGSGWAFQNVLTDNYIQPQTSTSNIFRTATNTATLYPARTSDKWVYLWTIANANGGNTGMHTDADRNVVMWYTNADASIWAFEEVNLTEEEIQAARGSRQEYETLVANIPTYQTLLDNLFQDKACTTLNSEIQALTDEQLAQNANYAGLPKDVQEMVLKVKNNTWKTFTNSKTGYSADYEKFFRIADYKIYSNCDQMGNSNNFTMSNAFGRLSGPTGIVANAGQIVYIYVGAAPKDECTLALEVVTTDGVSGNHPTGTQIALKEGLNVYMASQQVLLYIFHQLNNTQKYLADYPDIKIHIEGGELNGYWDATRGMTDADWALLQQDLLKAPYVNLKTERLVFQMDTELVTSAEPKNMEGLMRIWNTICANEDRYMGVEDFEGRYNNIWNVFSGASSYMHSTTRGTWYTESTIPTVMNYNNMRKPGNIWGPSHEIGHNHQGSINVIGTTESSNNLFSNINRFEQGIQTSRLQLPCDNFAAFAKDVPWVGRSIWNTTAMFFQLYLYFHAMHNDDQFYPNLFRKMRKSPINKWSGPGNGGATSYGKDDYLHLAKMICDVAQADLSEFFEAYGMFVPVDKFEVSDYSTYLVTTTQKDIDDAKKYMQKYPKKLGNIMFIDDHVVVKDAVADNIFEGLPSGTKKVNDTGQHDELGNGLPVGDVGDYEKYDGRTAYETEKDYCTVSSNKISFKGSANYLGHKFYDKDGKFIWATNAKEVTLPDNVRALGIENVTVVAVDANLKEIPCPYYKRTTNLRYAVQVYFGSEDKTQEWCASSSTDMDKYLPENAFAVVGDVTGTSTELDTPENLASATNVISREGTIGKVVINGDLPAYIPADAVAGSVKFTKTNEGYAALRLPFYVTSDAVPGLQIATYDGGVLKLSDSDHAWANTPVVVNGNVDITLGNSGVVKGDYQALANAKVLASDGKSVVDAETASPFTFDMQQATGIVSMENEKMGNGENETAVYDLSGCRIERATKGVYIRDGKKFVVK